MSQHKVTINSQYKPRYLSPNTHAPPFVFARAFGAAMKYTAVLKKCNGNSMVTNDILFPTKFWKALVSTDEKFRNFEI